VGGDYNAKHTTWGARITTTRGRELHKAMSNNNLQYLSTRQTMFWPSDTNRQPDLLDFCITKGINVQKFEIDSCLELSSDHTTIIVTMDTLIPKKQQKTSLYNKYTDWDAFREILDERIDTQIPLKSTIHTEEAVATLTNPTSSMAGHTTPKITAHGR
jgi:hypothetical protein